MENERLLWPLVMCNVESAYLRENSFSRYENNNFNRLNAKRKFSFLREKNQRVCPLLQAVSQMQSVSHERAIDVRRKGGREDLFSVFPEDIEFFHLLLVPVMAYDNWHHFDGLPLPDGHLVDLQGFLVLADCICRERADLGAKWRTQILQRKHFGLLILEDLVALRFLQALLVDLRV